MKIEPLPEEWILAWVDDAVARCKVKEFDGEILSVLGPDGRREIPIENVLALVLSTTTSRTDDTFSQSIHSASVSFGMMSREMRATTRSFQTLWQGWADVGGEEDPNWATVDKSS